MDADVRRLLDHPDADLEQAPADGGEFRSGERHPAGDRVAWGEHQPVGRGVQHQPELFGQRVLAVGAAGGELNFVLLEPRSGNCRLRAAGFWVELAREHGPRRWKSGLSAPMAAALVRLRRFRQDPAPATRASTGNRMGIGRNLP